MFGSNEDYEKAFNTVKDFTNAVARVAKEYMETTVATAFKEELMFHAMQDVYDVYTPSIYERDWTLVNDSMYATEHKTENPVFKGSTFEDDVYVYSTSPHALFVIRGDSYDWDFPYAYNQPRPFAENAMKDMIKDVKHIRFLFKRDLLRNGIDAR